MRAISKTPAGPAASQESMDLAQVISKSKEENLDIIHASSTKISWLGHKCFAFMGEELFSELISSIVKPWSQDWLIAARAYPSFCSMNRLEVFLLPLDGMLVHRRSLPCNLLGLPQQFVSTHLYTWVERGTV